MFVAVYPHSPSPGLSQALLQAGIQPVPVSDAAGVADLEPEEGWAVAIIEITGDPVVGLAVARRVHDEATAPVLICAARAETQMLADAVCDDFVLTPIDAGELAARIIRLARPGRTDADQVLSFKELSLDLATYQATLDGKPIDLTYMEYELLRFFVSHTGRVWSREQLLSRVWGYDYFGGARTVDVHVRRLRAKLGEERTSWITTVRSVGYRFG
ncbi:MAG: response regulator transcription factor [Acidobacteria bacterium]|nr:response regulator transcription factor [Acidobacteriota bacterium]